MTTKTPLQVNPNAITHAQCEELWKKVRFPHEGKPLPRGGYGRIFKLDNGDFVVAEVPRARRYYSYKPYDRKDLFTVHRDGRYTFHVPELAAPGWGYSLTENESKRLWAFAPVVVDNDPHWRYRHTKPVVIAPNPKRKPAKPKVADIEPPMWVEPGSYRRAEYEAGIKQFGDLDAWHAAYKAASKVRSNYEQKFQEWHCSQTVQIFDGLVVTREGIATKTSIAQKETRIRKMKADRDRELAKAAAAEAKRRKELEQARAKREREFKAAVAKFITKGIELKPGVAEWIVHRDLQGAITDDGKRIVLVKAVRDDYSSSNTNAEVGNKVFTYKVGEEVVAPDYDDRQKCGHGLHFSPTLYEAKQYWRELPLALGVGYNSEEHLRARKVRGMVCEVDLATLVVISTDKVKAERCTVVAEMAEVDTNWEAKGQTIQTIDSVAKAVEDSVAKTIADKMGKAARKAVEK